MTLLELVKLLRQSFLDDVGGSNVDWRTIKEDDINAVELRWTNEELTSHINEAIRQVYRRILPVQLYEPKFDISVVAGTAAYDLDKRIIRVVGAKLQNEPKQLAEVDHQDLWFNDNKWDTRTGTPYGFLPDYQTNQIRLFPTPVKDDTLKLFVNRFPLVTHDWECNSEEPELNEEWLYPMLNYVAYLAYKKDEANTYDPQKADRYLAEFNLEFPVTSAYSDLRKKRTTNRSVRYGGIPMFSGNYNTRNRKLRNPYGCNN